MANRKKFNSSRVCSSENYILSKKIHVEYLKEKHENFEHSELKVTVDTIKIPYVRCFGKLDRVPESMIELIGEQNIIWL